MKKHYNNKENRIYPKKKKNIQAPNLKINYLLSQDLLLQRKLLEVHVLLLQLHLRSPLITTQIPFIGKSPYMAPYFLLRYIYFIKHNPVSCTPNSPCDRFKSPIPLRILLVTVQLQLGTNPCLEGILEYFLVLYIFPYYLLSLTLH